MEKSTGYGCDDAGYSGAAVSVQAEGDGLCCLGEQLQQILTSLYILPSVTKSLDCILKTVSGWAPAQLLTSLHLTTRLCPVTPNPIFSIFASPSPSPPLPRNTTNSTRAPSILTYTGFCQQSTAITPGVPTSSHFNSQSTLFSSLWLQKMYRLSIYSDDWKPISYEDMTTLQMGLWASSGQGIQVIQLLLTWQRQLLVPLIEVSNQQTKIKYSMLSLLFLSLSQFLLWVQPSRA